MTKESHKIDQESYRLLVEGVKDYAIFMVDPDGYVLSWNKGAEQLYGYTESEVIGKSASVFYPEDSSQNLLRNLTIARKSGRVEEEGRRIRKNGSRFQANVVITALKDKKGNLIGFGKVTRDITEKNRVEQKVKRLNEDLEAQLQKSQIEILDYKHALDESCIVAITNQKGIIKYVNENFCKISKYSAKELLGQDHRIVNSGCHSKEFIRNLWVTIASGKIWRGELKNRARDGSFYWVDTTIVPFLNEKGKPYQYLAIRTDITERKLAEEQVLKNKEELEKKIKERTLELTAALEREKELNEMKSRFVSIASHEFRTPLSAILSSTSLVEHYLAPENAEKRCKHIERIKSSVRNLTDILNDFLSLEKLEQGKVEVKNEDFDLQELIEDVLDEMDALFRKKDHKVNFVFTGSTCVCQDRKVLRNVLLNLLSNAVKYSPPEKEIAIVAEVNKGNVSVSVKDQGIGIPPEAQKDLFTTFFRASNAATIQGTGLGLNIVKRHIELLGGTIHFVSTINEGSTFTIEFPQQD